MTEKEQIKKLAEAILELITAVKADPGTVLDYELLGSVRSCKQIIKEISEESKEVEI